MVMGHVGEDANMSVCCGRRPYRSGRLADGLNDIVIEC
jgi:hypothetical protein